MLIVPQITERGVARVVRHHLLRAHAANRFVQARKPAAGIVAVHQPDGRRARRVVAMSIEMVV